MPIVPSSDTRRYLKQATEKYRIQLQGTPAERYLTEVRGLTRKTLEDFSIGFVGDPEIGHQHGAGCITFPYLTRTGITAIRFRSVPPAPKTYFNVHGDHPRIYNAQILATSARKVVICEGELDTITATQCGLQAVGIPGVTSWNPIWARAFRFREVTILADGDTPGEEFARELVKRIDGARYVVLAEGEDVNSFVNQNGPEQLRARLGIAG